MLFESKKMDTAVPEFISIFSLHNLFHLIHDKLHDEANMCTSWGQEELKIRCCTTFSWSFCEEHGLSCIRKPNLSSPEYLWQWEISACNVLVQINVVPVKNNYFFHSKATPFLRQHPSTRNIKLFSIILRPLHQNPKH